MFIFSFSVLAAVGTMLLVGIVLFAVLLMR